jgi:hypothetical protein
MSHGGVVEGGIEVNVQVGDVEDIVFPAVAVGTSDGPSDVRRRSRVVEAGTREVQI